MITSATDFLSAAAYAALSHLGQSTDLSRICLYLRDDLSHNGLYCDPSHVGLSRTAPSRISPFSLSRSVPSRSISLSRSTSPSPGARRTSPSRTVLSPSHAARLGVQEAKDFFFRVFADFPVASPLHLFPEKLL